MGPSGVMAVTVAIAENYSNFLMGNSLSPFSG